MAVIIPRLIVIIAKIPTTCVIYETIPIIVYAITGNLSFVYPYIFRQIRMVKVYAGIKN